MTVLVKFQMEIRFSIELHGNSKLSMTSCPPSSEGDGSMVQTLWLSCHWICLSIMGGGHSNLHAWPKVFKIYPNKDLLAILRGKPTNKDKNTPTSRNLARFHRHFLPHTRFCLKVTLGRIKSEVKNAPFSWKQILFNPLIAIHKKGFFMFLWSGLYTSQFNWFTFCDLSFQKPSTINFF